MVQVSSDFKRVWKACHRAIHRFWMWAVRLNAIVEDYLRGMRATLPE